jgi:hypothetical protein
LQLPFVVDKKGPTQPLQARQTFNYSITVTFQSTARGVTIIDVLPPDVKASAANATWFTRKTNASTREYPVAALALL